MNLRHFKISEFDCSHTGRNEMQESFLMKLDHLRDRCGFPFVITSGYRDPTHPIEAKKVKPGTHSEGIAADISAHTGQMKYVIVQHAIALGFTGIGIAKTFVHVDTRSAIPLIWDYS